MRKNVHKQSVTLTYQSVVEFIPGWHQSVGVGEGVWGGDGGKGSVLYVFINVLQFSCSQFLEYNVYISELSIFRKFVCVIQCVVQADLSIFCI